MKKVITTLLVLSALISLFAFTSYNDYLHLTGFVNSFGFCKIVVGDSSDFSDGAVSDSVTLDENEAQNFSFLFLTNVEYENVTFLITANKLLNTTDNTSTLDYTVESSDSNNWSIDTADSTTSGNISFTNDEKTTVNNAILYSNPFTVLLNPIPNSASTGTYLGTVKFSITN